MELKTMSLKIQNWIQKVISHLVLHHETLALAESCTGGILSSFITNEPGVSEIFQGSVVSYSNQAKEDLLGVKKETLTTFGAVSLQTALEMALGARLKLHSDWSVAITGIAGPSGGTPEKPVGTVCFAVAGPQVVVKDQQLFMGDRQQIREQSAEYALFLLHKELSR